MHLMMPVQDDVELEQLTSGYTALQKKLAAASAQAWTLPDLEADKLRQHVDSKFERACQDLMQQHERLGNTEADNARTLNTRYSLHPLCRAVIRRIHSFLCSLWAISGMNQQRALEASWGTCQYCLDALTAVFSN